MSGKAWVIVIAILSWLATAAITVTVLSVGPVAGGDATGSNPAWAEAPEAPDEPLPRYGVLPVFDFVDHQGRPFSLNDLRGKVWVIDTIFTRCTAICPTLTGGMRDIQSALKLQKGIEQDVQLVSLSIDGGYDSPEVLRRFADAYGADPALWTFLTGGQDAVWPFVQEGLKLPVEPGPPGDEMNILHSGKLVLVDRVGVIRGYYDGLSEAGRTEMLADLRRLTRE